MPRTVLQGYADVDPIVGLGRGAQAHRRVGRRHGGRDAEPDLRPVVVAQRDVRDVARRPVRVEDLHPVRELDDAGGPAALVAVARGGRRVAADALEPDGAGGRRREGEVERRAARIDAERAAGGHPDGELPRRRRDAADGELVGDRRVAAVRRLLVEVVEPDDRPRRRQPRTRLHRHRRHAPADGDRLDAAHALRLIGVGGVAGQPDPPAVGRPNEAGGLQLRRDVPHVERVPFPREVRNVKVREGRVNDQEAPGPAERVVRSGLGVVQARPGYVCLVPARIRRPGKLRILEPERSGVVDVAIGIDVDSHEYQPVVFRPLYCVRVYLQAYVGWNGGRKVHQPVSEGVRREVDLASVQRQVPVDRVGPGVAMEGDVPERRGIGSGVHPPDAQAHGRGEGDRNVSVVLRKPKLQGIADLRHAPDVALRSGRRPGDVLQPQAAVHPDAAGDLQRSRGGLAPEARGGVDRPRRDLLDGEDRLEVGRRQQRRRVEHVGVVDPVGRVGAVAPADRHRPGDLRQVRQPRRHADDGAPVGVFVAGDRHALHADPVAGADAVRRVHPRPEPSEDFLSQSNELHGLPRSCLHHSRAGRPVVRVVDDDLFACRRDELGRRRDSRRAEQLAPAWISRPVLLDRDGLGAGDVEHRGRDYPRDRVLRRPSGIEIARAGEVLEHHPVAGEHVGVRQPVLARRADLDRAGGIPGLLWIGVGPTGPARSRWNRQRADFRAQVLPARHQRVEGYLAFPHVSHVRRSEESRR